MFRLLKSLTGSAATGSDDTIKTNTGDVKTAGFLLSTTSSMELMKIPSSERTELANYFNSISDYSPGTLGTSTLTTPGAPSVKLKKYDLWRYKCRIDQSAVPVAERDKLSAAATTVWKHIFGDEPHPTNRPYPGLTRPKPKTGMTEEESMVWNLLEVAIDAEENDPITNSWLIDGLHSVNHGDVLEAWSAFDEAEKFKPESSSAGAARASGSTHLG